MKSHFMSSEQEDFRASKFELFYYFLIMLLINFSGGSVSKESACNAGDPGSVPGLGRSPAGGNGNTL